MLGCTTCGVKIALSYRSRCHTLRAGWASSDHQGDVVVCPRVASRQATEHGHAAVHPWEGDLGVDPAPLVSLATAYGRQVGCYVVNDPARMIQLRDAGVWGFVTDVPDVAVATLRGSDSPTAGA